MAGCCCLIPGPTSFLSPVVVMSWSYSEIHRILQDCPIYYKLDARLYSNSIFIGQMANKSLEVIYKYYWKKRPDGIVLLASN